MQNPNILLEAAGVGEIASMVATATKVIKILTGERSGGTKYPISFSQYAGNAQIVAILDEVASKTSGWSTTIRGSKDADVRRRFIYTTAVVIPELALRLQRHAEALGYKDAVKLFKNLVTIHRSVNYDTRKSGDTEVNPNMFRTAAREFYEAIRSSCEVLVPTRPQTTVDEDYSASSEYDELLDVIKVQFNGYLTAVQSILEAVGLGGDAVSDEEKADAAKLNLAVIVINKYLTGAEIKELEYYSPNAPAAKILYRLVSDTWRSSAVKKKTYSDDADGQMKDVDVSEIDSDETDGSVDAGGAGDDASIRMEIKDMDSLGDNTTQMNTLNDRTHFTCRQFYKVFEIDPLSSFVYKEMYVRYMYRILYRVFEVAGFNLPVPSEQTADVFANAVNAIFTKYASNTTSALTLHGNLLNILDKYEANFEDDFAGAFKDMFMKDAKSDKSAKSHVSSAFSSIRRHVICSGSNSIVGKTATDEPVSVTGFPQPIVSFGLYSPDDRKKTVGLSTSGKIASRFFKFTNNELNVVYTGALTDKSIESDVIPQDDIRNIYKDYVSSSLMPIATANRTRAWVVLVGILAFSELKQGTFADVKQNSDLIQKQLDLVANANIYSNSQFSDSARANNMWRNKDLRQDVLSYGFMTKDELDNDEKRAEIIDRVGTNTSGNLPEDITKVRKMCDIYNAAITAYIKSTVQSKYGMRESDLRKVFSSISPMPEDLVAGGQVAIDNVVSTYVGMMSPGSVVDISSLCDIYTAYTVMEAHSKENRNIRVIMRNACYYLNKLSAARSEVPKEIKATLDQMLPEHSDSVSARIYSTLRKLDEDIANAQQTTARAKAKAAAQQTAPDLVNLLIESGRDGIQNILKIVEDNANKLANYPDGDIAQLYKDLSKTVEYSNANVTTDMVTRVEMAIAKTMDGTPLANMNKVSKYSIGQFVKATSILQTLMAIASPTKEDVEQNEINADYDISRGGTPGMAELTAMSSENENNAKLNQLYNDIHNSIDEPSNVDDIELNGDYIERVIKLSDNYKNAVDIANSVKDDFDQFREFVKTSYEDAPETDDVEDWVQYIDQTYDMSPGMTEYGTDIIKTYKRAAVAQTVAKKVLDTYKSSQPHMAGIIDAIEKGSITVDELKYAVKEAGIAAECLGNLSKYATTYGATKVDRRIFAYTMSDESAIAQIIYILSQYIMIPSIDDQDDLVYALSNAHGIIEKYSGNPMSKRVAADALSKVQSCTEVGELTSTVVKLICSYGKILLSRLSNDVDQARLMGVSSVVDPANKSENYGKAMDAFARTQLRSKGDDNMTAQIARLGDTLDSERAGRKSYISLVLDDMKENTELAKYAYTLGKAFNVFDRSMMDERVSDIEKRIFNSIESSFTGVALYKGLATNDLQRELISAIIDDERHNDTDSYPTVAKVLEAAKTGGKVSAYGQMYSKKVGSSEEILNDTRSKSFGFDQEGKQTDNGVPLDMNTIYKLVTDDGGLGTEVSQGYFTDIKDLVHTVRMVICNRIVSRFGSFDLEGNIQLSDDYADKANDLMKAAMKSLYRLCNDMDTPLSSIIVATNSLGQKGGRKVIMQLVSDKLQSNEDIDIDTLGMVSGEPNAYPQMMSNEISGADIEWVGNMANILARIPSDLSKDDVLKGTEMYCSDQSSKIEMMKGSMSGLVSVIEHLLVLDTPTGIPTGIWGDDSTTRKKHITDLMARFASRKTNDNTWVDCAQEWYNDFIEKYKKGKRSIAFASILPCQSAMRRIAHLRMNPYYTMDIDENYLDDVRKLEEDLAENGIILKRGNFVKLKYPGMTFDRNTFNYICLLAIKLGRVSEGFDSVSKFATALMCYVSGVRIGVCLDVLADTKDVMNSQDNATRQKIHQAMIAIAKAFYAKDCGEMVNTSLGWLTHVVFVSLCTKAAMTEGNPVENFRNLFSAITAGGEKSYKLSDVTKRVDGVPDEDAVTDEPTEEVPVENPEPAKEPEDDEEEMPTVIPAEPIEKPKQAKPASKRKKVNFAKLAELLDSDASEDSETELEENPASKDA